MIAESGKKIPLIPNTKNPHVCPEKKGEQPPPTPPKQEKIETPPKEQKELDVPPHRDFNTEKFKIEAKEINEWARKTAHEFNWRDFDQSETVEDRRARSIDTNVDKKDLFSAYYLVKYGQKKNSMDKLP